MATLKKITTATGPKGGGCSGPEGASTLLPSPRGTQQLPTPQPSPPRGVHHHPLHPAMAAAQKLARFLVVGTFIAMGLVAVPLYSFDLWRHGAEEHYIAWFSAGSLVLMTVPISIREIYRHLTHWYLPEVQKYVVRILWMVPIYAVESWLSLRFRKYSIFIETLRECYESYVIYCFFKYLVALLGDEEYLVSVLKRKPATRGVHAFPVSCCLKPWVLGQPFLYRCKLGVYLYVLLKNVNAVLTMVLEVYGLFGPDFDFRKGCVYITVVNNLSQMWAMYCLILFYYATREELEPWRPVGKFVSVKMVIFFTWWQGLVIAILHRIGLIHDVGTVDVWSGSDVAKGLQNFCICLEMLVAAIALKYSFTYKDYIRAEASTSDDDRMPFITAFLQSSLDKDVIRDIHKLMTLREGGGLEMRVMIPREQTD